MTNLSGSSATTETVHAGMGPIPHDSGVAFRLWAPHADSVSLIGTFNDWDPKTMPMQAEENGRWYINVPKAKPGDEYRYQLKCGDHEVSRMDPRAREVTSSVGNSVIHQTDFDWGDDNYRLPAWNDIVLYEMHLGTFNRSEEDTVGTFRDAIKRLDHLVKLGVNVVQLMPLAEFAGDISWGYNPAQIFAVESGYGGPQGLKRFVKAAHQRGIGVIQDVVYNHFGPSDLDIWQFDLWNENGKGGIYFYNDWRSKTPWGDTRPDYGRGEVRQFIYDNAMMWINDYHVDGLRYDMTLYMRSVDGQSDLPEGWSLAQWINQDVRNARPGTLLIAEDLQTNPYLTKDAAEGGAHFSSQWDAEFVHPVRDLAKQPSDAGRDLDKLISAITYRYNIDAFERVVYTESHDEVANGKSRLPSEINPEQPTDGYARHRSTLAAGVMMTTPGIPMLFQGQEFLQDGWFQDTDPLDWDRKEEFPGVVMLYRDMIHARRNLHGITRGLMGQHVHVYHRNDECKLIAYQRWFDHGLGDDVIVVVNFSNQALENYHVGFPCGGTWKLRLNSAAPVYNATFVSSTVSQLDPQEKPMDGLPHTGTLSISPYSMLIYSQDPTS
ncbi:1,4-alpha-glucan branching enzyme GlgB [Bremerella volcania]|uniref:1,4-alpha-glucan branching enzyme n=1 Tax=Bremerella volcania TaxID=2527984 RepID=A0A518CFW7_9BACT|nr:alpha-amylase family glycosyl hydrolase [Bremerella volcania]QDU78126.1 1,4-alpha-glucan branching enzyme GlgB [Bremerella volcania]